MIRFQVVQGDRRSGRATSPVHNSAMDGQCLTNCGVDCRDVGVSKLKWTVTDNPVTCRACIRIETYEYITKFLRDASFGQFGKSRQMVLDAFETIRNTDRKE